MIGHTMAAAGSLEAVATVLSVAHDVVAPTANHETADPEVAFDCVPKIARDARVDVAASNSFGFGGQNVTLVFGKP
jgi:3-oxoacyl-[acyl-carrier-protein] synthase II